jgi:sec-independent protein translocase protein TatB
MFDFAWTEIALIGVVALIAIGPKDLPIAIKTVAGMIKKARRMAGEFQGHVDEMVREANLHEVRDQITQLRNFDIKSEITKAVDSDGSLRATLSEDLTNPTPASTPAVDQPVPEGEGRSLESPAETVVASEALAAPDAPIAPAFVPPDAGGSPAPPAPVAPPAEPPSFIPPGTTHTA